MSRSPIGADYLHAGALFFAGGNVIFAFRCTAVRTATGVYTVTLEQGINSAESLAFTAFQGTIQPNRGDIAASVVHTSDIVKTISLLQTNAGTLVNRDFTFKIFRIRTGLS